MHNLLADLRYALRTLRNAPGFAAAAILTLALGVGANTAIFSVVNTVLLQPLPYRDPGRLVTMYETEQELPKAPVTMPDLIDWRERARSFESISSVQPQFAVLSGDERPERVPVMSVTPDLFQTLGVQPALGRGFTVEEGQPGGSAAIILGDELFRGRFGGDRSVVGRTIRVNGAPATVVGVMPPAFRLHIRWTFPTQAWMPMVLEKRENMRGSHDRLALGRLKPGVTVKQAQAEMTAIAAQLEREHPDTNGKIGAFILPMQADLTGHVRDTLIALLGAVGFVLLIACANVANLVLARGMGRRQELAIRAAMGAGRWRIARQLFTESAVLAAIGGAAGLALAYAGVAALRQVETLNLARLAEVSVDRSVLLFSLLITGVAGLLFGLAPALLQSRRDLHGELKESAERTVAGGGRASLVRSVLVASELGLAVVLLIGAGLMIRSVSRLLATPLGFRPEGVLTAQISLPRQYNEGEKRNVFVRDLLDRVRAIPGVTAASMTNKLPLKGGMNGTMIVEGQPYGTASMEGPLVESSYVYPGYFKAMGIAVRAGRAFGDADLRRDFNSIIVNETFVRVMLKGENGVGKRVSYDRNPPRWREIIGVVADTRQHGLAEPALPESYRLAATPQLVLVAHTTLDPASIVEPVRRQLASIDRDVPLADVQTMSKVLDSASAGNRTYMRLIGTFAAVALVLASIGIYGLIAFAMSQRRHEIGIRMALGATRGRVIGMALGGAVRLVAVGILTGVGGALLLTQYLKSLLYEVKPFDPATFAAVPLFLAAVALAASFLPALRATSLDPARALRHE